jgi:two-component system response regulator DesR
MRILLAEDQAMVRGALAALLGLTCDFQITQAADGDQALALLKQQDFDLHWSGVSTLSAATTKQN